MVAWQFTALGSGALHLSRFCSRFRGFPLEDRKTLHQAMITWTAVGGQNDIEEYEGE